MKQKCNISTLCIHQCYGLKLCMLMSDEKMEDQPMFSENLHSKEFQCPVCLKYFSRKFTLGMHLLIHKGVKPHPCPFCGKRFRQKGTLMRHKALHSANNLFHCSLCNRGFRQKNVFLHHLRHRHSVSTETLDRRKYRTGLNDYQSIMDTLPSFVFADSTAIASSEKHLDAMLFESFNTSVCDSSLTERMIKCIPQGSVEFVQKNSQCSTMIADSSSIAKSTCSQSEIQDNVNFNTTKDASPTFRYECGLCLNVFTDYTKYNQHIEEQHYNIDMLVDRKPTICSFLNDAESSTSSTNNFHASKASTPDTLTIECLDDSASCTSPTKVSSTDDANTKENVNLCIPCQQSFSNEEEFECHVKTHVQSVLLGDMNSDADEVDARNLNYSRGRTCSVFTNTNFKLSPKDKLQQDFIKNDEFSNAKAATEKTVLLCNMLPDLNSHNSGKIQLNGINVGQKSSNNDRSDLCSSSASVITTEASNLDFKLLCPFCGESCRNESILLSHARMHGSQRVLKYSKNWEEYSSVNGEVVNKFLINKNSKEKANLNVITTCNKIPHSKMHAADSASMKGKFSVFRNNYCAKKHVSNILHKNPSSTKHAVVSEQISSSDVRRKLFACKLCNKIFRKKRVLEYHRQMHLNAKGFRCEYCNKSYSSKVTLLAHTRSKHLKNFLCCKCFRSFNYRKLRDCHQTNCIDSTYTIKDLSDGFHLPLVDIKKLVKSDTSGIVGIIPVFDENVSGSDNSLQVGIPVVSLSHIKSISKLPLIKCPSKYGT